MATTAADPVFVDSNVLVSAALPTAPRHVAASLALANLRRAEITLWISRQVLREYLAVLSRPQTYTVPVPINQLAADVTHFQSMFQVAEEGPAVTVNLLALMAAIPTGGKQVHDANIVATMQANRLQQLLTNNVADFARFAKLITILPL